jgi:hypothetical protein
LDRELHELNQIDQTKQKTRIGTGLVPALLWKAKVELGFSDWRVFAGRVARLLVVGLLVVGTSEVLIGLDRAHRDPITAAFLVKNGAEYLVAWRVQSDAEFRAFRFESLIGAQRHLAKLGLVPAAAPLAQNRLERLWIRDEKSAWVVFWKIRRVPFTHRLTFRDREEAQFFFAAFEKGQYSPSPFGHAVVYSPGSSPIVQP